jgi:hypothetical protein
MQPAIARLSQAAEKQENRQRLGKSIPLKHGFRHTQTGCGKTRMQTGGPDFPISAQCARSSAACQSRALPNATYFFPRKRPAIPKVYGVHETSVKPARFIRSSMSLGEGNLSTEAGRYE